MNLDEKFERANLSDASYESISLNDHSEDEKELHETDVEILHEAESELIVRNPAKLLCTPALEGIQNANLRVTLSWYNQTTDSSDILHKNPEVLPLLGKDGGISLKKKLEEKCDTTMDVNLLSNAQNLQDDVLADKTGSLSTQHEGKTDQLTKVHKPDFFPTNEDANEVLDNISEETRDNEDVTESMPKKCRINEAKDDVTKPTTLNIPEGKAKTEQCQATEVNAIYSNTGLMNSLKPDQQETKANTEERKNKDVSEPDNYLSELETTTGYYKSEPVSSLPGKHKEYFRDSGNVVQELEIPLISVDLFNSSVDSFSDTGN